MTLNDVREFWDRRPCNARHSSWNVDLYPRLYSRLVTGRKFAVEPHIIPFSDFPAWRGKTVLDAGCGIGTMALVFALNGARVTGVDISGKSLSIARRRRNAILDPLHNSGNDAVRLGWTGDVRFVEAPLEHLLDYLPRERFDLIYSFGVLHHTPRPERALRSLALFADEDTRFKIMLYNRTSWKVAWIVLKHWRGQSTRLKTLVQRYSEAQTGSPVTHTYTKRGAEQLLASAGLTPLKIEVDHIFPYNIPAYIRGELKRELYWRALPRPVFRWLERRLGWHMLIDAVKRG